MYNKTSFINEKDYAEVSGTRWIMRDLPSYAEGHQLCAKLCAHNRIIQRSLLLSAGHQGGRQTTDTQTTPHNRRGTTGF